MSKRSFTQYLQQEHPQYDNTGIINNTTAAPDADADTESDADAVTNSIIVPVPQSNSKWSSVEPIELIRLTAQYLTLKQKLVLYSINHYWNSAINHPTAWISNPYNQSNCDNNILKYNPNFPESYLTSSLQYITIINFPYSNSSLSKTNINSRSIVYNSMKYLTVLIIYSNKLTNRDYELIGNSQLSHTLIRLELINLNYNDKLILTNNNLESLSKLLKLQIFFIKQYSIELSELFYINQFTKLRNLSLNYCNRYQGSLLFHSNIIQSTSNKLLYLDINHSEIYNNSLIKLINMNQLSNLLVLKCVTNSNSNLLLTISLLINLTVLDLNHSELTNTILTSIGRGCKLLKRLSLSQCNITEPLLSIGEFHNLDRLNLDEDYHCKSVRDPVLLIISQKLLKLKYFSLGYTESYTIAGLNYLTKLVDNYELIGVHIHSNCTIQRNLNLLSNSLKSIIIDFDFNEIIDIYSWNHIQIPIQ